MHFLSTKILLEEATQLENEMRVALSFYRKDWNFCNYHCFDQIL